MEIEWKNIKDYEDYKISNNGLVKNKHNRILKHCLSRGHCQVILCKNGNKKHFYIHRLVLIHFGDENINDKPYVDHIDGNPENNNINNLRWANCAENVRNSKKRLSKLNEKNIYISKNNFRVRIRNKDGESLFDKTYSTIDEAIKIRNNKLEEFYGEFCRIE